MDIVSYGRPAPSAETPPGPLPAAVLQPEAPAPALAGAEAVAPAERGISPPLPSEGGRLAWVDIAKGICIVLVVMMHATLGVEAEMGREGFMHWAVAFSKPFRMPDFFLVSGLFLSRVIDRDWRSYGDKRVVHFAYFYVLWLVIQSLFKVGQLSGGSLAGFGHHLLHALVEPYSTLWFIYILAVFSVATKLLRRAPPAALFAFAALLEILPVETGSFLVNEFCERWVYFLAGYLFAPAIFRLAEGARANRFAALAGIAAWALANGWLALTPAGPGHTVAELPVIGLLTGIAGALAIVALASLMAGWRLVAPLRYAGSNSIAIYLTFFLPMAALRTALIKTGIISDAGTVAALVTAAAVVVPLAVERLVRGTRLQFLYRRPRWARLGAAPAERPMRLQPAE